MKNCSYVTVMLKSAWRYYGLKMFQNHFLEGTEKEEPEIVKKEHGDSDEYVPFSYFTSQFFFPVYSVLLEEEEHLLVTKDPVSLASNF